MSQFTIHTEETAPPASRQMLEASRNAVGFVPSLFGVLAEAPKAYQALAQYFEDTSLTTTEQHVVWLTVNYENDCGYCVPAHTGLAKLDGVADDVIQALRDGSPLADPKLEALRPFTIEVVNQRGWVPDESVQAFLGAGYTKQKVLEVVLGVAHKVFSNYTNHVAETPVDSVFPKFAWEKPAAVAAS